MCMDVAQDDLSGRQQWQVTSAGNGLYTITMPQGRAGCDQILSAGTCASGSNAVNPANTNTPGVLETWAFVPVNPATGASASDKLSFLCHAWTGPYCLSGVSMVEHALLFAEP